MNPLRIVPILESNYDTDDYAGFISLIQVFCSEHKLVSLRNA